MHGGGGDHRLLPRVHLVASTSMMFLLNLDRNGVMCLKVHLLVGGGFMFISSGATTKTLAEDGSNHGDEEGENELKQTNKAI